MLLFVVNGIGFHCAGCNFPDLRISLLLALGYIVYEAGIIGCDKEYGFRFKSCASAVDTLLQTHQVPKCESFAPKFYTALVPDKVAEFFRRSGGTSIGWITECGHEAFECGSTG